VRCSGGQIVKNFRHSILLKVVYLDREGGGTSGGYIYNAVLPRSGGANMENNFRLVSSCDVVTWLNLVILWHALSIKLEPGIGHHLRIRNYFLSVAAN
jgi:hypothetical protein